MWKSISSINQFFSNEIPSKTKRNVIFTKSIRRFCAENLVKWTTYIDPNQKQKNKHKTRYLTEILQEFSSFIDNKQYRIDKIFVSIVRVLK